MKIHKQLENEWKFLASHAHTAISISNTAKGSANFKILPRRYACDTAVASFLINDRQALEETITFFDGKVESIYIDVEQKQDINLLEISKPLIKKSKFAAIKPNDIAIEACDLLLRHKFHDDISNKDILIIGTGNLASKMALRTVERQANVYIHGRDKSKEETVINGINLFLPKYTESISAFDDKNQIMKKTYDIVISFLSGQYWAEEQLLPLIDEKTLIIDGGISNFSSSFIEEILARTILFARLDVRFALTYQFMATMNDSVDFYNNVFGKRHEKGICLVAGGYLGEEGSIILDQIERPTQVIGIADGRGGVKDENILTEKDRLAIQTIQESMKISTS